MSLSSLHLIRSHIENIVIRRIGLVLIVLSLFGSTSSPSFADTVDLSKVVIIKADDLVVPWSNWDKFLAVSRRAGAKVSIGIIAENSVTSVTAKTWTQKAIKAGDTEFWIHGWDHKQWVENNVIISEFKGSGYAYQWDHFSKARAGLTTMLGLEPVAFGPPFNGFDLDTASVINAPSNLQLLFIPVNNPAIQPALKQVNSRIKFIDVMGESDGTGKPNAKKFITALSKRASGPVSLQFHPGAFDQAHLDEYAKILKYLTTNGYQFMLPSDYIAALSP